MSKAPVIVIIIVLVGGVFGVGAFIWSTINEGPRYPVRVFVAVERPGPGGQIERQTERQNQFDADSPATEASIARLFRKNIAGNVQDLPRPIYAGVVYSGTQARNLMRDRSVTNLNFELGRLTEEAGEGAVIQSVGRVSVVRSGDRVFAANSPLYVLADDAEGNATLTMHSANDWTAPPEALDGEASIERLAKLLEEDFDAILQASE